MTHSTFTYLYNTEKWKIEEIRCPLGRVITRQVVGLEYRPALNGVYGYKMRRAAKT